MIKNFETKENINRSDILYCDLKPEDINDDSIEKLKEYDIQK